MATMRPTPRNELLGLLSDYMAGGLEYMRDPQRTQQLQGLAGLLESTGIPKTTERMAYGEPLTNIGRANVPLLKPETADALMTVAPFAPKGMKMIRATEGLPVGMSIKDVGKSAITREGNPIQGAVVLVGDKIFMGRTHGDALNRAVYEGTVRKEGGKYIYPKGAEVNSDLFMTKDGQIIDRLQASKMFDIGASETAIEKGLMQNNPPKSMTVDSYIEQATALKKQREQPPVPQQAALDLAQQKPGLLEMTRTPSEAEIKKMSREDLLTWLQNNDPNGQYMDPTPNPSVSMYRTGKGYAVENADSGDVFEFKDFNEAQDEFNSMRFSNAEFQPMTLKEAQESAINYLRESAQPAESAKVLPFQRKGLLSP
jgi:hypothetical protein